MAPTKKKAATTKPKVSLAVTHGSFFPVYDYRLKKQMTSTKLGTMKVAQATPTKPTKTKRTGLRSLRGVYAEVMAKAVSSAVASVRCATTSYSFSNTLIGCPI